jgi:AcrR family transcriptional regulator
MPKVTDEYRDAKRREIADAALRAFQRRGFQATSMADIIAESGMSAGAIYGHYKSKTEIMIAAGSKIVGARIQDLNEWAERTPMPLPAELVRRISGAMTAELGDTGLMVQLWGEAVTEPELRELAANVVHQLKTGIAGYLSAWHQRTNGLTPDAAEALALEQVPLFVGASQGYIVQNALLDDFDSEAYFRTMEKYLPC